ncbi:MAG: fibronectin type III domain-containing protein [Candidatus Moraniibacteriota bacterium]
MMDGIRLKIKRENKRQYFHLETRASFTLARNLGKRIEKSWQKEKKELSHWWYWEVKDKAHNELGKVNGSWQQWKKEEQTYLKKFQRIFAIFSIAKINFNFKEKIRILKNRKLIYAGIGIFLLGVFLISLRFWPNKNIVAEPTIPGEPYDYQVENTKAGYAVDFTQIKNEKEEIKIGKINASEIKKEIEIKNGAETVKSNPTINTDIVYGNENLKFDNATIKLKKTGPVNAIVTCSSFDQETKECKTSWGIAQDVKLAQVDDNNIEFQVKHFSAYAGVYLEILNFESNLTQGDDWTVNFNTYGQSDLIIEATDGTNYPTDIAFKNISCGENQIPNNQIEKNGNTITVRNYECTETSVIRNQAVSTGIHWLSFDFGETQKARAHNFACNTGTLNDTCTVSSSNTMTNNETIGGTGNLVIASGGALTSTAENRFTVNMTGGSSTVTIQSGGTITGNVTINAVTVNVNSGGSINVDGKGYAGGTNGSSGSGDGGGGSGGAANPFSGAGGGYGGHGENNDYTGGSSYGANITQPTELGSGGGSGRYNGYVDGGAGGGAVKIVATGTVTVTGSVTANGTNGVEVYLFSSGGGSGGSIWIQAATLAGSGSITANGGISLYGGTGGGGRIVLDPTTSDTFNGSITVSSTAHAGTAMAMGTIIRDAATTPQPITISSATSWIGDIRSMSDPNTSQSGSFTFSSLTINTGITLTASVNIITTGDITVTGNINANGLGYSGGKPGSNSLSGAGPGGGVYGIANGSSGSGGGYGGHGGAGSDSNGGITYGSVAQPTDLGSGSSTCMYNGRNAGAAGGGALKIVAGGALSIGGSITANGSTPSNSCYMGNGGGSGGSIWIVAGTLAGAGTITANGGNGVIGGGYTGGVGGGGRIAIQYTTKTYSGTPTVIKGTTGVTTGAADGTIFDAHSVVTTPADGADLTTLSSISGTATSSGTISSVAVSIKDLGTDGTGTTYWTGSTWGSETWNAATGTTSWSYTSPTWTHNHQYLIRSRATDSNSGVETPGTGNTFLFWGGTIISSTQALASSYTHLLVNGGSPYITGAANATLTTGDLRVKNNSNIVVNGYNTTQDTGGVGATITATGDVTVDSGSTINANGTGYAGGTSGHVNGYGTGGGGGAGGGKSSGGGYGGVGGVGNGYAAGGVYGSATAPTDLGSGGGSSSAAGGAGGGAIKINATGTVTNNGSITANGGNAPATDCVNHAGSAGSGGSIWIISGALVGSGSIKADGGEGYCVQAIYGLYGAAGGGGRVALYPSTSDTFTGSITALSPDSKIIRGEMGTIVRATASTKADITISTATSWVGNIKDVSGNAGSFSFNSLTINNNATLTASVSIATDGNFTLASGATINATGQGYSGGLYNNGGSGPGGAIIRAYGAGGGYGGAGGFVNYGGHTYGSLTEPIDLGSGGSAGVAYGGAGGGAIKINATGTADISGAINANGNNGSSGDCVNHGGGGGSGGSIWIISGTLTGSGSMTANGGNRSCSFGGGGGGGRIAFSYDNYSYTGALPTVTKGTSVTGAEDGTIYGLSPISTITAPEEGDYKNASFTTITGTAFSPVGTVSGVQISIKDVTDGTHWYNGTDFTTATSETWLDATGTTSWAYTRPTMTTGHVYLVRSKAADNTAYSPEDPSVGTSFTYDNSAPTTAVTITNDYYKQSTWDNVNSIAGTASDADTGNTGVTLTEVSIQGSDNNYWTGSAWSGTETWVAVTSGTTAWTYTLDKTNFTSGRTYTVRARATDGAGNVTSSGYGSDVFAYDTVAPTTAVTITNDYYKLSTWDNVNSLAGTASDTVTGNTGVTLTEVSIQGSDNNYWTGSAWSGTETWVAVTSGTTAWTYTLDKTNFTTDRTYTVRARATDGAGNTTTSSYGSDSFTYDSTLPIITFDNDVAVGPTQSETVNISVSDTYPDTITYKYIFSVDNDCATKNYASGTSFTSEENLAVINTETNNAKYICAKAEDLADNVSYQASAYALNIDITDPATTITTPDATNNGGFGYSTLPTIEGTLTEANSNNNVKISIKDTTDGSHWWSGSDWSVTSENNSWITVTSDADSWSYDASGAHVTWTVAHQYLIKSKATDTAGNEETPGAGNTFTFINSHPVVSNVVAVQKNDGESNAGKVEVTYNVTDTESSSTIISLFYDSSTTLATAIPNNSSTAPIQTTDGSRFPTSGTIIIKKSDGENIQYEYIAYTGKSVNNLTGISRSQEGTVGTDHPMGEQIFIKATSLSGAGSQTNGTGKAILWDAPTDTDLYATDMTIRVASNDESSSNNVGVGDSATLEFDTLIPDINSANVDGSEAIANEAGDPAMLNLDVMDDTTVQMMVSLNSGFSGASWVAYDANPTIMLVTDPDTAYVKFKDAKGNISATETLTTPERPDNFMVQDTSNVMITPPETRLFIAWETVADPTPGFGSYKVYRSENQTDWDLLAPTILDRVTNYYGDNSVIADTVYTYRVVTTDADGNRSFSSAMVDGNANGIQDAGEGGGGTSSTPTVITNVHVDSTTTTTAIIHWTTDTLSTSTVGYSTTPNTFTAETGSGSYVTDHSVTVFGLAPNSTYYFQVKSTNPAVLTTISKAQPNGYTFDTQADDPDAPVIDNINETDLTERSVTITWDTNEDATSFVEYSTQDGFSEGTYTGNFNLTQSHSILVDNLNADTTYYYKIHSEDESNNEVISDQGDFHTLDSSNDTTPPVISNISSGAPAYNTATITWTTNENASSFVEFGTTNSYGRIYGSDTLVTSHSVILPKDLLPETTYHFRVRSKDASQNEALSDDGTFLTATDPDDSTAPTISAVTLGQPTTDSITITWTTNEVATSYVGYSQDQSYTQEQGSAVMATAHSVTLAGLTPGTFYYVQIKSTDPSGNIQTDNNSGDGYTFSTESGAAQPVITNIQITDVDSSSVTIRWTTDIDSNSLVEYGLSSAYGQTYGSFSETQNHIVTLDNLLSSATYHFRVRSAHGTEAVSGDFTFNTSAAPDTEEPDISDVQVENITTDSATVTWTTNEDTDSILSYGTSLSYTSIAGDSSVSQTDHSVTLTGLNYNTLYHFQINSKDTANNITDSADQTFTTDPDITDPVITDVTDEAVSSSQALITWTTDENTSSQVVYSTDESFNLSSSVVTPTRKYHSVLLSDLTADTLYNYKVISTDVSANAAQSDPGDFTTSVSAEFSHDPLTEITDIADPPSIITDTKAVVTFDTNQAAQCTIEYGTESCNYSEVPFIESDYNENHSIHMTGLIFSTVYYYRITCEDNLDNIVTSAEYSFTALEIQTDHTSLSLANHNTDPTITLKTDTEAIATFNAATTTDSKLCYSTTSSINMETCTGETAITNSKIHAYHLTNLTASTAYYLKMKLTDSEDVNDTYTTGEITFTTLEKQIGQSQVAVADATAPSISSVSSGTLTGESATITWTTDEDANSSVSFGITSGTYENGAIDDLVNSDAANYATSHTAIINNLTPATKYYYIARSVDASGNIGESAEETFTTKSSSAISSVSIVSTSLNAVTITWTTAQNMTSIVEYGLTVDYGYIEQSNTMAKDHQIELSGLKIATLYHFRVKGKDANNNLFSFGDYTFQPKSPPKISGQKVDFINEQRATVTFTTDIPTSALITYTNQNNPEDSGTQGKSELAVQHNIELKNLTAGATYAVKISASDEQGNQTEADLSAFTTAKDENPPEIDQVKTDSALAQNDKVQTIISWVTNEPATTSFFYKEGVAGDFKELTISEAFTQSHIVISTVFKPGTVYHFKVKSVDQSGNEKITSDFALLTPRQKENIIQIIVSNFEDIFNWTRPIRNI